MYYVSPSCIPPQEISIWNDHVLPCESNTTNAKTEEVAKKNFLDIDSIIDTFEITEIEATEIKATIEKVKTDADGVGTFTLVSVVTTSSPFIYATGVGAYIGEGIYGMTMFTAAPQGWFAGSTLMQYVGATGASSVAVATMPAWAIAACNGALAVAGSLVLAKVVSVGNNYLYAKTPEEKLKYNLKELTKSSVGSISKSKTL